MVRFIADGVARVERDVYVDLGCVYLQDTALVRVSSKTTASVPPMLTGVHIYHQRSELLFLALCIIYR
jgi:hypothetical protein